MSALHWFEIPVTDIQRAVRFYETVMNVQIPILDLTEQMGSMLGMLPDRGGAGGALVQNPTQGYTPSMTGTLVYLVVDGDLNSAVGRVEGAGGRVLLPKTQLGGGQGGGFIVWIADTEGNRVALYAQQ
jgi:predicted enzyme related to lactoylglutathione lyase